ncbi:MAG TPA: DUF3524 domain-containing protein [Tepidisphaeraceae bacterium]|nr:DUF3524 domain-containing protein [Tepidisphaeraceae bacterium]
MAAQLDILALEPFYGGTRRQMLETIIRCSRHRWTLLKLPPRRIERRLTAAAIWFAEQLSRHWVGQMDLLFTSEALNLADFYRLMPQLSRKPSVVYFHSNQLPDVRTFERSPLDMVNLNTAQAANEIWFNSMYHLRQFLSRATALVLRHDELLGRNPMNELAARAQLMLPPVDFSVVHELSLGDTIIRNKRKIFVETRDAHMKLLNAALATLVRRKEQFELVTVGPVEELDDTYPRTALPENDERSHVRALMQCGVFISTRIDAPADSHAVRALAAGCSLIVPDAGVYPELIPDLLQSSCLYDGSASALASRLQDLWHLAPPDGYDQAVNDILHRFDPVSACNAIDQRVEELVAGRTAGSGTRQ